MRTYFRNFTRDDETEVECEYSIDGGSAPSGLSGPPEFYDAGSDPEVCVVDCWLVADENANDPPRINLTDDENDRFAREVLEDPDTYEPDYED